MGGRALRKTKTVRFDRSSYDKVKRSVLELLRVRGFGPQVVPELPGKDSFGDLDVMVVIDASACEKIIREVFSPAEVVRNGNVFSFDYDGCFQVDVMPFATDQELAMACFFLGYGDFGAILGGMASARGLKFGEQGMWLNLQAATFAARTTSSPVAESATVPAPTGNFGKVILSQDPRSICAFLGLDFGRWSQGFATEDEVVSFLLECRLYDPLCFTNLNTDCRRRANTRPFYQRFLNRVGGQLQAEESNRSEPSRQPLADLQAAALDYFDAWGTATAVWESGRHKSEYHVKMDSARFVQATGLQAREIGPVIVAFKKFIISTMVTAVGVQQKGDAAFKMWVSAAMKEEVWDAIDAFCRDEGKP